MESLSEVPVIDVESYLNLTPEKWEEQCKIVAQSLHQFGILIWKDPRVNESDNEDYLDMMEQYFEQNARKFYSGQKLRDCKPEFNFQAGVTPEKQERARNHQAILDKLTPENMPLSSRRRTDFGSGPASPSPSPATLTLLLPASGFLLLWIAAGGAVAAALFQTQDLPRE